MSVQFLESSRGKPLLLHDGSQFRQDRQKWRCLKTGCRSRAEIRDGVVTLCSDHDHAPDIVANAVRKNLNELHEAARGASDDSRTSNIVDKVVGLLTSEAVIGQLPNLRLLRKQVSYTRKKVNPNPTTVARTLKDIVITHAEKFTLKGELFLLHDSGPDDPCRIIVFATPANLMLLRECPE
ncbi:uncharacterized protein LOC100907022 [Galendromus occidentalis]|uniref:Uncharacterized protein LOC100907022 n=1 Tax=Galendromus occidentalis TaxID=34638 RepID=A0AAJ6VWV7_9ACAR|nr:uncharacterized protein LOC100907022 [Galendromus occidentalis]